MNSIPMQQLFQNTPLWVWAILILLIWLGSIQMRLRVLTKTRAVVVPIIMVLLSLYSIMGTFGLTVISSGAWVWGIVLAYILGIWWKQPVGLKFDPKEKTVSVPGSLIPFFLMMLIFLVKYFIGASLATHFLQADNILLISLASLFLGLLSGIFITRTLTILRHFRTI